METIYSNHQVEAINSNNKKHNEHVFNEKRYSICPPQAHPPKPRTTLLCIYSFAATIAQTLIHCHRFFPSLRVSGYLGKDLAPYSSIVRTATFPSWEW